MEQHHRHYRRLLHVFFFVFFSPSGFETQSYEGVEVLLQGKLTKRGNNEAKLILGLEDHVIVAERIVSMCLFFGGGWGDIAGTRVALKLSFVYFSRLKQEYSTSQMKFEKLHLMPDAVVCRSPRSLCQLF